MAAAQRRAAHPRLRVASCHKRSTTADRCCTWRCTSDNVSVFQYRLVAPSEFLMNALVRVLAVALLVATARARDLQVLGCGSSVAVPARPTFASFRSPSGDSFRPPRRIREFQPRVWVELLQDPVLRG